MKTALEPAPPQRLTHLSHAGFVPAPGSTGSTVVESAESGERHSTPAQHGLGAPREAAKPEASRLRTAVEEAQRVIARGQSEFAQRELALAQMKRQEFWLDTCRETAQMHVASAQVLDFYRSQGCRFFAPSHEQVQEILDALDTVMSAWDFEHPELFYQTLELNFPECLRRT